MIDAPDRPLSALRFTGELRSYQSAVMEGLERESWLAGGPEEDAGGRALHLVAPPGSGKTILGLALAVREGRRALVLAPTTVIRDQWAEEARTRFALEENPGAGPAGERRAPEESGSGRTRVRITLDSDEIGDLSIMTYQKIAAVDRSNPFTDVAREQWIEEMELAWSDRERAEAWLEELRTTNRGAYSAGLRKRAAAIRKDLRALDPAVLEKTLHPNALRLIGAIVRAGVGTIVLDECHHLLDHWALVVHLLRAKLREAGLDPLLIGLTATPPDPETPKEEENYSGLLGEVDYEVPTPAVIRAGDLAPFRTWAWFTDPTPAERSFIDEHAGMLDSRLSALLASPDGRSFLLEALIGPEADEGGAVPGDLALRMRRAVEADPYLALSAGRMLSRMGASTLSPLERAIVSRLPDVERPALDDRLLLVARHALTRLLPDDSRAEEWRATKSLLQAFGYHLTDRGIRRGPNPIDTTLARSESKERAVLDILRLEDDPRMRAAVVTDLAQHNDRSAILDEDGEAGPGGALRCFSIIAADPFSAHLHPVLVTGKHLRILAGDEELAGALRAKTGAPLEVLSTLGGVCELAVEGAAPSVLVDAVAAVMTEGLVRLVVGTRGLLGEGWDCPALNTLIDLTTVTTSTATQQLHGRTLRLDPAWPRKAAHNWVLACLPPKSAEYANTRELERMERKAAHLWGLSRIGADEPGTITRGIRTLLDEHQLDAFSQDSPKRLAGKANAATRRALVPRESSFELWRTGSTASGRVHRGVSLTKDPVFEFTTSTTPLAVLASIVSLVVAVLFVVVSGLWRLRDALPLLPWPVLLLITAGLVGIAVWSIGWPAFANARFVWRTRAHPTDLYRRAAIVLLDVLAQTGAISRGIDPASVIVEEGEQVRVEFSAGTQADREAATRALAEMFTPIGVSKPRHVLALGPMPEIGSSSLSGRARILAVGARIVNLATSKNPHYLAVPAQLGATRESAGRVEEAWNRLVGPARVVDVRTSEGADALVAARAQNRGGIRTSARVSDYWS